MESHAEFLRRVSLDEELAAALRRDHTQADLAPQDRAMLDFTAKLTTSPASMGPGDVQGLRDAGFDDRGVLQIAMIGAWFNYVNRIADALGVGRGTE